MLYVIGAIALILIIYGLILFLKKGNKEFEAKLSLRERTELEKMLEKQAREEKAEDKREYTKDVKTEFEKPAELVSKENRVFPTKDINAEIARYSTHIDINNFKVQNSVRSGVENFINLEYKTALEDFSLAIETNPHDITGFYCRGLTKFQLKNHESALSDFTECINLRMREPNAFYYRGLCYFFLGDMDNAILNFKSYINSESNSSEAYFDLALCFKQKENDFEAINYLSMAIELNPKYEVAYLERGLLKHKLNDVDGGCADLKKSLDLGYLGAYYYVNDLCKKENS